MKSVSGERRISEFLLWKTNATLQQIVMAVSVMRKNSFKPETKF